MNTKVTRKLAYGVYLLSAREGGRDNACIINTAVQVANDPTRISIAVIKANLTCDMIAKTSLCNLSAITEDAEFSLFQRFGMQSGRDADKFAGFPDVARSGNGLLYLTAQSNGFLSLRIVASQDLGSHMLFIGELVDGEVLSDAPTATYNYYQTVIKNRAPQAAPVKKGWRCVVCGYIYEGETLPPDFVCPICKHGPEDFEPIGDAAPAAPEPPKEAGVTKWVCTVCGYVHKGPEPPEKCPLCSVPAKMFKKLE